MLEKSIGKGGPKMKFLHTGDWHLGKKLGDFDLRQEQWDAFLKLVAIAKEEKVDAIVIAGDLYDSPRPNEDSVALLNRMLVQLNLEEKYPLLMINGNHDSAVRLNTGNQWYRLNHFYLNTRLEDAFDPVEIGDCQFFLVPYFKLAQAKNYFDKDYQDLAQAMQDVVACCQEKFVVGKKHVFVGHFFAAGSLRSDSETKVEVGGLGAVPVDLFASFDYVALGHIHKANALQMDKVKYSGSPLKFSASEAKDKKGVWIVDTNMDAPYFREIQPLNDLYQLKGTVAELTRAEKRQEIPVGSYVSVTMTDEKPVFDSYERLLACYPHMFNLQRKTPAFSSTGFEVVAGVGEMQPTELVQTFFSQVIGKDLEPADLALVEDCLQKVRKED